MTWHSILYITCIILVEPEYTLLDEYAENLYFWHNNFTGAKNAYQCPQGANESDDEAIYENTETIFQQKDDSDKSDNDYVYGNADEQTRAVDNDYEDDEVYANCVD